MAAESQPGICNNMHMAKAIGRRSLAVAAWVGVIFFSSTSFAGKWCVRLFQLFSTKLFGQAASHSSWSIVSFLAEKGVHVTLFLILATLLWKAIKDVPGKIAVILLLGLMIGSASEFLQRFFPGRDPSVRDILINLGGTAMGVALNLAFARSRQDAALKSS